MKRILFLIFAALLIVTSAHAADLTLAWDANSEASLAGYRLHYKRVADTAAGGAPYDGVGIAEGDSPISYPLADLDDPQNPRVSLTGLSTGTYYFAVTAYDDIGSESGYSNEVDQTFWLSSPVNLHFVVEVSASGEITIRAVN